MVLYLGRKFGESVVVETPGGRVVITLEPLRACDAKDNVAALRIEAPDGFPVQRKEIVEVIDAFDAFLAARGKTTGQFWKDYGQYFDNDPGPSAETRGIGRQTRYGFLLAPYTEEDVPAYVKDYLDYEEQYLASR